MKKTEELISTSSAMEQPARRNRRLSTRLENSVVEETVGQRPNEDDEIESCFNQIIDVTLSEFDKRFTENNEILVALSKSPEMQIEDLKPLEKLGIKLPAEHELKTAKTFIDGKRAEWEKARESAENEESQKKNKKKQPRFNILDSLFEFREVFSDVYNLFAAIETFGCSTAVCESSFSSLSQINVPSRLSMSNNRMRNLAFMAFESKRLDNVESEVVLRTFNNAKQRKVQLF